MWVAVFRGVYPFGDTNDWEANLILSSFAILEERDVLEPKLAMRAITLYFNLYST